MPAVPGDRPVVTAVIRMRARSGTQGMRRILLPLGLLAVLAAGCGGGDAPAADPAPAPRSDAAATPGAVVRAWSRAMRRGDIDAAARLFAVPAVIANGTSPINLDTRAAVRRFNASLPCGSRVVATEQRQGLTIATFTLTERPGARCDGTGNTAKAAFEIRGGKIVGWIRVADGDVPPAPGGRVV